jgi:hypothetical protein
MGSYRVFTYRGLLAMNQSLLLFMRMPQRKSKVSGEKPSNIVVYLLCVIDHLLAFHHRILPVRYFQHIALTGVDDLCFVVGAYPGFVDAVTQVDMAVEQVLGLIFFQEGEEGFKATVGIVVQIAHSSGGCVGHNDVYTAGSPDLEAELPDPFLHFTLGVLVVAGMIPGTAAQTQDPQTVIANQMTVDTVAALRRFAGVGGVVVSMDVKQRAVSHGHKKREVRCLQVAGGDDQVVAV